MNESLQPQQRFAESKQPGSRAQLAIALETALLRELQSTTKDLIWTYFRTMRPATILLTERTSVLGEWQPASRTIELSRTLVIQGAWPVVIEVLKHELAHQYVNEVLGVKDEGPHGATFKRVCDERGISGASKGAPLPGNGAEDAVLSRVRKLLALADSPNLHESEAAMAAAQRLILKHNIDKTEERGAYSFVHLGEATGRVFEGDRVLAAVLAEFFFVEVIWIPVYRQAEGKRGTVLEACGRPENLEMAGYVHSFLKHTAESLWRQHQKASGAAGRDRLTFVAGVMTGFFEKLRADRSASQTAGLVWVGDPALRNYLRKRHPRVSKVRLVGQPRTAAHQEGRAAGKQIVLHRPIAEGPSQGARKLLPR